jgi:hypothetical protein
MLFLHMQAGWLTVACEAISQECTRVYWVVQEARNRLVLEVSGKPFGGFFASANRTHQNLFCVLEIVLDAPPPQIERPLPTLSLNPAARKQYVHAHETLIPTHLD